MPARRIRMTVYLSPGNDCFQSARNSEIYIDKSDIIRLINRTLGTAEGYICMTRPRRFGKTITADMLAAYYDNSCDSHALFDDLMIAQSPTYEQHLNQYHVIQVDVQGMRDKVGKTDFEQKFTQEILKDMCEKWPQWVTGNEPNLFTACHNVYEHTKTKFIFIFDEWDCIARNDKDNVDIQKNWIIYLRSLFKDGASRKFTALVYLTGILPIRKYGSQSALGHFKEYTIVSPLRFSPWVGFTEDDVKSLAEQYDMSFDALKYWYDGYLVRGKHIYNPSSVVTACVNGECNMYWTKTESFESLKHLISANFDHLKERIVQMLNGEFAHVNVDKFNNTLYDIDSADDVLTLLIHIGYLGYDAATETAFIPNEEVRRLIRNAVEDCGWLEVERAIQLSNQFMANLLAMNGDSVAHILEQIHAECCSILKYNDENSLSCAIGFAAYTARKDYTLIREMPAGRGFTDIVMIPRPDRNKPGILIELKWNKSIESAIDQIYQKHYPDGLDAYKSNLILVSVNYDKDGDGSHTCKIMKYSER